MSQHTAISWCDSTFNSWIGCTRVSPACDDCYAARSTPSRAQGIKWGAGEPRHRTAASTWRLPARWNDEPFYTCACGYRGTRDQMTTNAVHACGVRFERARRRVFCASLADWLDNEVPIEWLVDLLDLIRRTPNLDWLLLTKRIGNWRGRLDGAHKFLCDRVERPELAAWIRLWLDGYPPDNVWLGATVVNQPEADRDVHKLLDVQASVHFISYEPALGALNLTHVRWWDSGYVNALAQPRGINWVIAGGESGQVARPMHPDWVRSLLDQCQAAGVPFHFKQWGEWIPEAETRRPGFAFPRAFETWAWPDAQNSYRVGKARAGRQLDGRTWDEFPR